MENLFKTHNLLKTILLIAIIMSTASQSSGQHGTPIGRGYAPVNGIKVYYEVYGDGQNR